MRRSHPWFPLLSALFLSFAAGCPGTGDDDDDDTNSDDDDGDDDDAGCGFPEGGSDGAASISAGSPVVLDTLQDQAQNTLDLEYNDLLAPGGTYTVAVGPCGDAGLLVWQDDLGVLAFADPVGGGALEIVGPSHGPTMAALLYDADCAALLLAPSSSTEITQYTREGPNSWTSAPALADAAAVLGAEPNGLTVFDAEVGADGQLYLFGAASMNGGTTWLRGVRDATAGAAWTFEAMALPEASEIYDVAVGPAGETVVVFKNTQYPCDPCDVDFYLGTLATPDGSWSTEVIQPGKWGDPHDEFVESASVAFGADGSPYVAAHFVERVITGSYVLAELRLYGDVDGAWCGETVADANDGYEGLDGGGFTGADPTLVIDGDGRMHVAFRDQAIWHDNDNYQNEIRGQLRYAVRSGSTWTVETLLVQPGQTATANPLIGISAPLLAVSPDGGEVVVAGVAHEWETDSIYNNDSAPVTLEATAVGATLTYP